MKRTRSPDDLNGPEHTPRSAASTAELTDRLWIAAENQDVISIVALTRAGADPNAVRDGGSILTAALRIDDHTHDAVTALLDAGADPNLEIPPNARGNSWGSVLSCAVYCDHPSIVRLLLARGAQPHMDALRKACTWKHIGDAEALICAGCRIDVATEPTISDLLDHVSFGLPFHGTTREHRVREFATLFVRAGARIDTQTQHRFPGLDEVVTDIHNERQIAKRTASTFIAGCAVPVEDSPAALLAGFPEIAGFIAFHSLDPVCTARVNRRPELP
ncbi:MAG: ankyrin repeat domain-containing protein [Candidatus Omnitrophota bacterium]